MIILRMRQRPTLLDKTGLKLVSGHSQFLLHPFADHDAHADDDADNDPFAFADVDDW